MGRAAPYPIHATLQLRVLMHNNTISEDEKQGVRRMVSEYDKYRSDSGGSPEMLKFLHEHLVASLRLTGDQSAPEADFGKVPTV